MTSLIWSRSYTVYFLARVSCAFVFQMCELEVATSLVKAMTNGAVRWSVGRVGETHCVVAWGANMPSMPTDSTDPGLWCPPSPTPRESHRLGSTCVIACECARVNLLDFPWVWHAGVKIRCEVYVWWITNMWDNRSHSPSSPLLRSGNTFLQQLLGDLE